MNLNTLYNAPFFAYGLQHYADSQGIDLYLTWFNEKTVTKGTFSPTFMIFKALRKGSGDYKAFAYVAFRMTRECVFSSVSVLPAKDFGPDKFTYKKHVREYTDTPGGLKVAFAEIVDALLTVFKTT